MGSENKRVSKSGRIYYTRNPAYKAVERTTDIPPFMHSRTDPHYLRYFEKKTEIRNQYPFWSKMSPEQWRGYYERVYTLMQTDVDYQHWIKIVNATERQKIDWDTLDRKIQRSKDYPNGFAHDM